MHSCSVLQNHATKIMAGLIKLGNGNIYLSRIILHAVTIQPLCFHDVLQFRDSGRQPLEAVVCTNNLQRQIGQCTVVRRHSLSSTKTALVRIDIRQLIWNLHTTGDLCHRRPMPPETYATGDLCHRRPVPPETCATGDLCHRRPVPPETCATGDLCHRRPVPPETCATGDLCHRRPVPPETCATGDLCHRRPVPPETCATGDLCDADNANHVISWSPSCCDN